VFVLGGGCVKDDLTAAHAAFAGRVIGTLVEAAVTGQGMSGRGVLWIHCDSESLTWTYKQVQDCADEMREWPELERLVSGYEPKTEVVIAIFDGSAEFYCLPVTESAV